MLARKHSNYSILEQFDFGAELHSLKSADLYLQQTLQFYSQFNEFCKEISELEKEHARKLESVIQKYQLKYEKQVNSNIHSIVNTNGNGINIQHNGKADVDVYNKQKISNHPVHSSKLGNKTDNAQHEHHAKSMSDNSLSHSNTNKDFLSSCSSSVRTDASQIHHYHSCPKTPSSSLNAGQLANGSQDTIVSNHLNSKNSSGSHGKPIAVENMGGGLLGTMKVQDIHDSITKTWLSMLNHLRNAGLRHQQFSTVIHKEIMTLIKQESTAKDEARKRHLQFLQVLLKERNQAYEVKDKCKSKFDQLSDAVNFSQIKHDRTLDDKGKEKLKRQWHQDILDMNNAKNQYLLSLKTANHLKSKYFTKDIPETLKDMHELGASITLSLQRLFGVFVQQERILWNGCLHDLERTQHQVDHMDGNKDVQLHLGVPSQEDFQSCEPADFEFVPTGLWKESAEMVQDDHALIFLQNTLIHLKKSILKVDEEINQKEKLIDGLKTMEEAYAFDSSLGNASEIKEKILELKRQKIRSKSVRDKMKTEIDCILEVLGELPLKIREHKFKPSSFAFPTTCDYCLQTIWGMSKLGIVCQGGVPPVVEFPSEKNLSQSFKEEPCFPLEKQDQELETGSIISVPPPPPLPPVLTMTSTATVPPNPLFPSNVDGQLDSQSFEDNFITKDQLNYVQGPESQLSKSKSSFTGEEDQFYDVAEDQEEKLSTSHAEHIVSATVLYDFTPDPTAVEEISVRAEDRVFVVESDDGSGWTRIQAHGFVGVVPTTYIQFN